MAHTKRVALVDEIWVDGVDFSDGQCRAISSNFEHERVPAGGFNSTGTVEELSGSTTREITATFYASNDSGSIFHVLRGLFEAKTIFDIRWNKNQNASVSATNPELRGSVKVFQFPQGATFGEVETFDVTFVQAQGTTLVWNYT